MKHGEIADVQEYFQLIFPSIGMAISKNMLHKLSSTRRATKNGLI